NSYKEVLEEIREIKRTAGKVMETLYHQPIEFPLVHLSIEKKENLLELGDLVHDEENFHLLKKLMPFDASEFDLLWLTNKLDTIKKLLTEEGIEWTVEDAEVEPVFAKAIKVLKLKGSWW